MRVTWGLVLVALAACTDGAGKEDADGDGVPAPLDCDNTDPAVNPGASEACDEVDNNCNGEVDENALAELYADGDGDGFGAGDTVTVCSGAAGYVRDDGDCDDTDGDIHPDAAETCDDVDRNCDGNPTIGATDFPTFYFDSDQDGFGVDDNTISTACTRPAAYAEVAGDCDDLDDAINPDGVEICNGEDDDCNGAIDNSPSDAVVLYDDADGDAYGDPATGAVRCADAGLVADDQDCDDTDRLVRPGASEVCDGVDNDCDPGTDEDVVDGDPFYVDGDGDGLGDSANVIHACTQPPNSSTTGGDCDDNDAGNTDGAAYYDDNDLDGFGDPASQVRACTPPVGLVSVGNDCNDGSDVSYPGAAEICDTLDNDCDGSQDENVADAPQWYTDTDGDLFGDPTSVVTSCTQPLGTSAAGTDCDDTPIDMFPGNPEVCDGGRDNDCNPATDEAVTAVNYRDADGDGYGTDSDTVFGCSPPPGYVAVTGDCDDTNAAINPIDTPGCVVLHCGTISLSETWSPPAIHRVTCDVSVQGAARPTLTVTAGTVVEAAPGVAIKIAETAEGRLLVVGDPLVPARFTSNDDVKGPGQWDGIWIGSHDTGSMLTSVIVDSGGAGSPVGTPPGGVNLVGADPVIDDLRAVDNLGAGLVASTGAEPLVVRSTFTGNTSNGVYVGVGAGLSRLDENGTQGPSFQDNVVTGNGDRPITVPGSHADEIDLTNTLSPNGTQEIELLAGVLRFTGTWYDHALPYVVAPSAVISVEDGPAADLLIEDDVELYFNSGSGLNIGVNAAGRLRTGDVLMTGTPAVIANSLNWLGVTFGPSDLGSTVIDVTISYGGANTKGNLYVNGSSPTIRNVDSSYSDYAGISVAGTTAAPLIQDSFIHDNDTEGVFVASNSGIARSLSGPSFTGNTITDNGAASVLFPPNFIGELDASTTFANNGDRVAMHAGTVFDDAIWQKLGEDYEVRGDVVIGGPRDPEVEISAGNIVYFDRGTSLQASTIDDGVLNVVGTPASPVRFTSSDLAPGPGDWEGVVLGGFTTSTLPPHHLENLVIEHAGGSAVLEGGAIEVINRIQTICGPVSEVELVDVQVLQSAKSAYYQYNSGLVRIDGFQIDDSPDEAFYFDPGINVCAFTVESMTDPVAHGVVKPVGVPWGIWPINEQGDMADPSHVGLSSPTFYQNLVTVDTTLVDIGVPLYWGGIFNQPATIGSGAAPTLTINPGVEVRFFDGGGLKCGTGLEGQLRIDGAVLTSGESSPAPGDWYGVDFGDSCTAQIDDSTFQYGGGNGTATLSKLIGCCDQAGDPVATGHSYVRNSVILDSATCGVSAIDNAGTYDGTYIPLNNTMPAFDMTITGSGGGAYCP